MNKSQHTAPYTEYHKTFRATFGDAVWFAQQAFKTESPAPLHLIGTYVRNSILNAALSVECAANCCLDAIGYPTALTSEFERLRTVAKYELFLLHANQGQTLDRKDRFVKPILELIELRNTYVHAKVVRHDFDLCPSSPSGVRPSRRQKTIWPELCIPRMYKMWRAMHAKSVVTKVCDFYNYFFFVLCAFDDRIPEKRWDVAQILTSEVERNLDKMKHGKRPLAEWESDGYDDKLVDEWGLDFSFLGIISFADGKRMIRPSDRFLQRQPLA